MDQFAGEEPKHVGFNMHPYRFRQMNVRRMLLGYDSVASYMRELIDRDIKDHTLGEIYADDEALVESVQSRPPPTPTLIRSADGEDLSLDEQLARMAEESRDKEAAWAEDEVDPAIAAHHEDERRAWQERLKGPVGPPPEDGYEVH
jgi:hypothetical protein